MVRAFAVCLTLHAAHVASAQTVAPQSVAETTSDPEPNIAAADATPVSACGKHDCQTSAVGAEDEPPTNKGALLKQKLAEMNCLQSEIDALRVETGTPQAILVKMEVTEVSRKKLRELGVDFDDLSANGHVSDELLDWLKDNNVAKVISRPNIAVTCGRPASFMVGGEVPMPTVPGSQQVVEFKRFGTEIELLAIAKGENRLRIEVRARVSEIDEEHTIEVAGKRVPGFSVRQVDSALDVELGQTAAISGSVQKREEAIQVGDEVRNVDSEIEVVFSVTPEVVDGNRLFLISGQSPFDTATSKTESRPGERSLRASKPRTTR